MPQIVDAHVGKPQFPPDPVPKQIEIGKRLSRSMAGEQPRKPLLARDGANDCYGFVREGDMARLAGLGQGYDEQTQVKADIFPL